MFPIELDALVIRLSGWFIYRFDCVPEFFGAWATVFKVAEPFVLPVDLCLVIYLRIYLWYPGAGGVVPPDLVPVLH